MRDPAVHLTGNRDCVVQGSRVTFTPASTTVAHSDTAPPASNFERTTTAPRRTFDWSVTGNELTLTADGKSATFHARMKLIGPLRSIGAIP